MKIVIGSSVSDRVVLSFHVFFFFFKLMVDIGFQCPIKYLD